MVAEVAGERIQVWGRSQTPWTTAGALWWSHSNLSQPQPYAGLKVPGMPSVLAWFSFISPQLCGDTNNTITGKVPIKQTLRRVRIILFFLIFLSKVLLDSNLQILIIYKYAPTVTACVSQI